MAEGYYGELALMVAAWTLVSIVFTYAFKSFAKSRRYSLFSVFVTIWLTFFFMSLGTAAYVILGG